MRITIVGAGAMGSLFGGMLSGVAEVCLLDPWAEHVAAIRRDGLRIEEPSGEVRATLSATTDPAEVGPTDLAIVFVKSHRTQWASETAASFLKPDGLALTLQNGIGNRDVIARVLGEHRAWQGTTAHGATLLGPGHVRHAGKGPTHVEDKPEIGGQIREIAGLFGRAGIETHVSPDVDSLLWGKLVINVGINALTALLRVRDGVLSDVDTPRRLMENAVEEAVQVARARGVSLPYDDPQRRVREVATATGANLSSMLQDVQRGSPTEIDFINGVIVRQGRELGVPVPVNEALTTLIKAVEETYPLRTS
jgi:2-dehydropantoate 2-reductase